MTSITTPDAVLALGYVACGSQDALVARRKRLRSDKEKLGTWSATMASAKLQRKVVYKITYPNGKIYVVKDLTDSMTYFGQVNEALVAKDFSRKQRRDFTIRKEIIWESDSASDEEVSQVEAAYIRALGANDPTMGYNEWPEFKNGP